MAFFIGKFTAKLMYLYLALANVIETVWHTKHANRKPLRHWRVTIVSFCGLIVVFVGVGLQAKVLE